MKEKIKEFLSRDGVKTRLIGTAIIIGILLITGVPNIVGRFTAPQEQTQSAQTQTEEQQQETESEPFWGIHLGVGNVAVLVGLIVALAVVKYRQENHENKDK